MMKERLLIFAIVLTLGSCINPFAPGLTDKDSPVSAILTDQRSPVDVLTNFRYSYVFKDSLIYSDLLDSSFIFISTNYATVPPTNLVWGRDVDIKTTLGLFRHFDILELTWGDNPIISPDSTSLSVTFQLTFDGGHDIPTIKGEALFNFRRLPSGVLKIERWEDLSSF
jgi:hypothetical protein